MGNGKGGNVTDHNVNDRRVLHHQQEHNNGSELNLDCSGGEFRHPWQVMLKKHLLSVNI